MTPNRFALFLRLCLFFILLAGMVFQPQSNASAAANLTITPLTWNVVGLDSNNVNVGPNNFPVGARVCNTGDTTATNVSSTFNWEAIDPTPAKDYISLRPGSNTAYSGYTLAPLACVDFYYEVQVTRNSNAYEDTRRYYITATADALGTISTPTPREIFVERLISQNRNAVSDVRLNGVSIPAGGTMNLMVGNTYTIQLVGSTATQGYEQLESFINFPNTIFQVNSVTSTYSANAGTDPLATGRPYANGCNWVNDPGSPNYRSCTGTGKYGGNITVTYNVTILGGAGTTQTLNTLIYDFSGSSYHYNADFSTGARLASIIGPSSVEITKTFTPRAISPGGTSVLTFRLTNPTTETITGVNFTDSLLGGLKVAATPNVSYSGCGAGAFSPVPVANATSLSFSNGSLAPNSTCTIAVTVTADTAADYPNTTSNLFINGTLNTGNSASDTLKVSSVSACVPGQTLVTWTFPSGSSAIAPAFTSKAANVITALASTTTSSPSIETNASYGNPAPSWGGQGFTGGAYFQFQVDTSKYTNVTISFNHIQTTASWNISTVTVASSSDGTTFTSNGSASLSATMGSSTFNTTSGSTYFRISATGAQNTNSRFAIDNVTFTGCLVPAPAPTITKSFLPDPIVKGATSTLTFTINNTAVGNVAQTGISFTDVLPDGLSVANATASACNGSNNLITTAATRTIALTGGSLAAGGSCTFNVTVTGTLEGSYENITGFLSSNESGTSTSYATDTLTVIAPPEFEKSFSPSSNLINGTSSLQFIITNPNQGTILNGIGFTDTLPAGVTAVDGVFNTCNGILTILGNSLTFIGGSVNANSSCTFTVTVTGTTTGTKNNTTSVITSLEGGNGNAASATLVVSNPQPLIGLLKQISTDGTNWVKFVGLVPTGNIYYRFTISNDGETTLNNISVTDPNVNMGLCLPALPTSLAVGASASCVVGPISISSVPSPNPFVNTATVTTSTYTPGTEGTSSAQYGTKSLSLDKTADRAVFFAASEIITYSYLVTNNGGYPLLGPVTVADNRATVTCPAVSTVGDIDNYLDPGESLTCTATYSVTAGDVAARGITNIASASADGATSNNDTVTVTLAPDLTVTKTNNVSGVTAVGNDFSWTISVTNNGNTAATFTSNQTILSDPLPAGATYSPVIIIGGGIFGNFTCAINSGTLACIVNNGGSMILAPGATLTVTIDASPTTPGSLVNTATVDPDNLIPEVDETNNTGSNTVTVLAPPSISKSFGAATIPLNGTTTLSFTITNPNTGVGLIDVAFTDTLPPGLEVSNSSSTQCGGILTTTDNSPAADTISLNAGTIAETSSCTFDVTVTGTTAGIKNNLTGNVTSSNGSIGNTASASVTVVAPPAILKTFGTSPIAVNGTSLITFAITNPAVNTVDLQNVAFIDTYPTGMQNAAVPNASTTCVGGSVTAAPNGNSVSLTGASIPANSSCSVTVTVTATIAGTLTNSVFASSTNGGTGNTSFANLSAISVAKSVISTSEDSTTGNNVTIGEIVRYRLVIDLPEGTTTNLQILDNLVTNLRYLNDGSTRIAFVCNSSGTCAASSTASIGSNPVILGNSGNVTPTFVLPAATITNNDGGATTNPFPSGDDPLFSLGDVTNSDSDADSEYVVIEFNALLANLAANQTGNSRSNTFSVLVGGTTLITSAPATVTLGEPAISAILKSVTATPTDAGDTITYQLQFTNTGTSSAFDISVTDTLPTAVLTTPVIVSGSTSGGACGSTASTVSGSYSAPTATATITCLVPGGTATINISATVSSTAVAGYTFSNSSSLTYTSLPGAGTPTGGGNSTGSTTPGGSGTSTGERNGSGGTNDYIAASNIVNTTLANPSLAKTINPPGLTYAIGATIPYEITISVPEGVTGNPVANLVDTLPTGLTYVPGSLSVTPQAGVTIGAAGPYTDSNASFFNLTGQTLTLTFDSLTSTASGSATNRTITVSFLARVDNVSGNQSGTTFTNSVDLVRTNPNGVGTITLSGTAPVVSVVEPVLTVDKVASTSTPGYNSTLTYTLTISHLGPSNSPAFDTVITDLLPSGLTNLTNVNVTSTAPTNCATGIVNNSTANALNVTMGTIPLGCAVTITYDVTVTGALGSTQTNSVNAVWTSGSGLVSGERTGADGVGGALNDYAASTSQTVTVGGPDLTVVKTDGSFSYTPGAPITYTITVSNIGNSDADGTVTDTFPLSLTGISWTCVGTGNATCAAGGTGDINDVVYIPPNEMVTYTVNATVLSSATGNLVNTATAMLSSGTDPTPSNNSSTDLDEPDLQSDLAITKTDGVPSVTAGGTTIYTIRITNAGPSNVVPAIQDPPVAGLTKTDVDCSPTPGQCLSAPSIAQLESGIVIPQLAPGEFYEILVTANVIATSGSVTNTATVAIPVGWTDPDTTNNTASDTDTVNNPSFTIAKDADVFDVDAAGDIITYTVTLTNTGNVILTDVSVTDPLLANLDCDGVAGAPFTTTGLTIAVSGTLTCTGTYTVTQNDLDTNGGGDGLINNTVTGDTNETGPQSASEIVELILNPAIQLLKTGTLNDDDGIPGLSAGDTIRYAFTVTNPGNVTLSNITLADTVGGVTISGGPIVSLAPGAGDNTTFTGAYTVTQADLDAGSFTNTATVTGTPPSGPNVSDNDRETITLMQSPALTLTKIANPASITAVGEVITYTFSVQNTGNVTLTNVTVTDPLLNGLNCTTIASLVPGAPQPVPCTGNTYTVTQTDLDTSGGGDGDIDNTATATGTPPGGGTTSDTDSQAVTLPPLSNLALTKTLTTAGPFTPGQSVSFTITVTNNGPDAATGLNVTDTGTNLTVTNVSSQDFTCTGSAFPCTLTSLANGASATITVTATVDAAGTFSNSAAVTGTSHDSDTSDNTDSAGGTTSPPDLAITKTGPTNFAVGVASSYTLTVANNGSVATTAVATVTDILPASLTPGTMPAGCAAIGQTVTCTIASGLAAGGGTASFVIPVTPMASALPNVTNTASVTGGGDPNCVVNTDCTSTLITPVNPTIDAVDDDYSSTPINGGNGGTTASVMTNDTTNGVAAVIGTNVTLTPGTAPAPAAGSITMNADGTITVAAGTTAGTYTYSYTICTLPATAPATCDTAVATVVVNPPPAPIAQDDSTTTSFNTPATLPDITANDTAFGTGNSIVISTIDLDPAPGQQTNFTDASGNQWSVNTTTGDVTFTPATNFTGTATIPYWVQDATGQVATANLSVTVSPPASISGVVFNDLDLNGTQAAGEPGIGSVSVYLYDTTGTTLIASTSTTAGGAFSFPNLPAGDYLLVETDPSGYVSSTANSVPVSVSAGGSATVNFGDYQIPSTALSSISGTVFNDANGNGTMDVGESPLSGVTIQLTNNVGTVIATTTTNAAGGYAFANLPAGLYTVIETDPPGYVSTTLNTVSVPLSSGSTAVVNFGDQSGAAQIADPAVTKNGSPASATVGSIVVYTITVGNNGNINASNVVLTDTKPSFLDIISITISPNPGLTPVISGNTFTINFGTVTPGNLYIITVVTRVNSFGQPPGGSNNVSIATSSTATDRQFNNVAQASLQILSSAGGGGGVLASALPATGFAPDMETRLPAQPQDMLYAATDVVLEIPSLGIKLPIVGVPKKNGTWDVSWLGNQVGWLEGSAFPSWKGNSLLTSHVYASNGSPGPFVNLSQLKYGDQIIVRAYGQKYIFEVQTNQVVLPNNTSAFKHEEKPWLTLITCKEYDERLDSYRKRVVVRAVLVSVMWDR